MNYMTLEDLESSVGNKYIDTITFEKIQQEAVQLLHSEKELAPVLILREQTSSNMFPGRRLLVQLQTQQVVKLDSSNSTFYLYSITEVVQLTEATLLLFLHRWLTNCPKSMQRHIFGVSSVMISHFNGGVKTKLTKKMLNKLAGILHCSVDFLQAYANQLLYTAESIKIKQN